LRKTITVIMTLLILITVSACTAEQAPQMYIERAKLTEQEQDIVNLLGADVNQLIYDFKLDETVKSVSINTYELRDGEWVLINGGGGLQFTDTEGRASIDFDSLDEGLRIAIQSESNSSATAYTKDIEDDDSLISRATSSLSDRTEIEYDKEIPLAVQIASSKSEVISYSVEYFSTPEEYAKHGYENVYAVTIIFSQNDVK